jgi:hypothetical protein
MNFNEKKCFLLEPVKKVIYLDQFSLSNIVNFLYINQKQGKIDEFWKILYDKLLRLNKLQKIICPYSLNHIDESLFSKNYELLKKTYKILSNGIAFKPLDSIKILQISQHIDNWIAGDPKKPLTLNINEIVNGRINSLTNKFIISADTFNNSIWIENLRKYREAIADDIIATSERWQTEKSRNFYDWFEEERSAYGKEILRQYILYIKRSNNIPEIFSDDYLLPNFSYRLVEFLKQKFDNIFDENEAYVKVAEYLTSDYFKEIPFIKLASLLYASLARSFASGRINRPTRGIINDFDFISVLLPYCDALFIDNECYQYLNENPLKTMIEFKTNIYSLKNKNELINYLDNIENEVTPQYLKLVKTIYGDTWL